MARPNRTRDAKNTSAIKFVKDENSVQPLLGLRQEVGQLHGLTPPCPSRDSRANLHRGLLDNMPLAQSGLSRRIRDEEAEVRAGESVRRVGERDVLSFRR